MSRPLRAERYAEGASPSFVKILTDKLPYWSFYEAIDYYAEITPHLTRNELALLGCNDRFYLLTGLLNRTDAIHPWLYDRAREVEHEPDGHLDLWSRWHYKSTIITFAGAVQEVLINPEVRIGIFSFTKDIADPFVKQIKEELESNETLQETYPDVLWGNPASDAPTWSVKDGLTVKRKSNPKECTIEGHGLMNALPTGRHFPILIYDDVVTERNVTNPDQMIKAVARVEMSFNLGVGEPTRKWFIGTRYSYGDAYGHLLEKHIATPRLYPATDDGTIKGNPVFMTPEAWATVLREQSSNVNAQMLQNPIAGAEQTFLTKWLIPYWIRPVMMNVYIMVDPSMGRSKSSDRTAMAVVGIDAQGNKYLLDGYCHRMKLSERWTNLMQLYRKWSSMPGVQLLKVGYERYGMQSDIEYFEERMRIEGPRFTIEEINWVNDSQSQSKAKRVGRLEPDFRLGNFFVPGKVWVPAIEHQGRFYSEARWMILDPENVEQKELRERGEEFHYVPLLAPHKDERRAEQAGEHWRIFDPLRRLDEEKNIYDVTRVFFEEYRFWPASPRKDFIDAMSRIYDLDPMPAVKFETVEVEDFVDS